MKIIALEDDKNRKELFEATASKVGIRPWKELAFARKELLEQDVAFKQKFYYSKGAHYETATLGNVMIVPKNEIIDALREDYKAMENMIYGNIPAFDDVVEYMKELESEIHKLEN